MAGGMRRTGTGIPLRDRAGPTGPSAGQEPPAGVEPPPGTACWIVTEGGRVPGVILGWQQDPSGGWHALVGAWWPRTALHPRDG